MLGSMSAGSGDSAPALAAAAGARSAWSVEVAEDGKRTQHFIRVVDNDASKRWLLRDLAGPALALTVGSHASGATIVAAVLGPVAAEPGLLRFAVWAVLGAEDVVEVANMPIGLASEASDASALAPWGWKAAAQHFAANAPPGADDTRSTCLGPGIPSLVWLGGERAEVMAVGGSAAMTVSALEALRSGRRVGPVVPGSPLVVMEHIGMGKVPDGQLVSASVAAGRVAVTTESGFSAVRLQANRWAVVLTPKGSPMRLNGVRATTIVSVGAELLLCTILESSGLAAFLSFPLKFSSQNLVATGALVSETFRFTGAPIQGASMTTVASASGPCIVVHFPGQAPPCFHTIVLGPDGRVSRTCAVALAPSGAGSAASHARITDLRPGAGGHGSTSLIVRVASADGSQHHILSASIPAVAVVSPPESRRAEVLAERTAAASGAATAAREPAPSSPSAASLASASSRGSLLRPRDLASKAASTRPADSPAQPTQHKAARDLPERKGAVSSPVPPSTVLPEAIQSDVDDRLQAQPKPASSAVGHAAASPAAASAAAAAAAAAASPAPVQAASGAGDADYARGVAEAIAGRLRPAMAGIVREAAAETASAASSVMLEAADELTTRVATAAAPALQAAFIATFQRELAPAMAKAIAEMTRQQAAAMKAASDAQVAASERLLSAFEARAAAASKDLLAAVEAASKSAQLALRAAEQATTAANGARAATSKAAEAASAAEAAAHRCGTSAEATSASAASLRRAADEAAGAASRATDAALSLSAKVADAIGAFQASGVGRAGAAPDEDSPDMRPAAAPSPPPVSALPTMEAGPCFEEDSAAAAMAPPASAAAAAAGLNGHRRSHSVPPPADADHMTSTLRSYADGSTSLNSVVENALEQQDAAAVVWMCAELEAMGDSAAQAVQAMSAVSALCLFQQLASSGPDHLPLRFRWLAPTGPRLRAASDDETVREHLPSIAADAITELRPVFSSAPAAPGLDAATKADIRAVRDFLLTFT
ncbi:hypothetical protein FNF27_00552 [Cafeteria roenbergensis]|uniref:Uncharacterized protein n=3 Tax=Cafeteria roenbergensis TaxID=33653 RepID=A0A5A8EL09_CAFRO|nr:hypothetical protein FNF27_00552 [Cafeteria roenbergensis]